MDRKGPKTAAEFKDSLVFQRDLAEMLKDELVKMTAGMDQLTADKLRLLQDNGRMRTALSMIAGPVKRTAEEMKALAKLGLGDTDA